VNDDLERWINLEGPPPDGVRELLDAACGVHEMTPEQEARMDRRLHAALAEDRRRRARRRAFTRGLSGALAAACLAAGVALAFHLAAPSEVADAQGMRPNGSRLAVEPLGRTKSAVLPAAPPASATAEPQGAVRRPESRSGAEPLRPRLQR
jgi:hypothetical protein